ncbi:MAG: 2-amino-4-hydroxy-6-hydroxymethyldihydropteridine diphosphokinase [Dehalococcoidales bacterium]|nr:2-amino-4-hydroxy-6-hydroxymethyldihydropteridine diphosphokinase [Dehalococcoidales bacterium]
MNTNTVYLGLGSNLGNRQNNLDYALELLSQRMKVIKVSSVYETDPVGKLDQPRFLNMVCQVNTMLAPQELLTLAKGIELKMGRLPKKELNAPRIIDIDILLYGDTTMESEKLTIPHPRLTERSFVLIPLDEIAPDVIHPIEKKTVKELLAAITEKQGVFKWDEAEEK